MAGSKIVSRSPVRRAASCLAAVLVLASACTPDDEANGPDPIASAGTSGAAEPSPTVTPAPAETIAPEDDCRGLGRVPAHGQITFFEDNELRAASPSGRGVKCLAEVGDLWGNGTPPVWNATGDRVLLRDRALSRDGSLTTRLGDEDRFTPTWSRPSGKSVIFVSRDGALMKGSSFGGEAVDISFLERHDDVTYHPAGEHIATTGLAEDGSYGLYLATNVGGEPKLLARGEAARFITNLHFTEDGESLYYTARHGPRDWHLHRLFMGPEATLETLAKRSSDFEYVVSPFDWSLYAWFVPGDCAAGEPGTFKVERGNLKLNDELRARDIHPVGWLPRGKLVVRAATGGCSTAQPGDVYVLSAGDAPRLIEEENYGNVSVRVKMPPPPPPPGEEQEVVA